MSAEDQTNIDDVPDDVESNYDIDDVEDVDVEDTEAEVVPAKVEADAEIEDDDEEVDDDGEDDDPDAEHGVLKKRHHMYHQIPESTEIHIVHPTHRVTSEYMSLYEYSMIVGTRATHISSGSVLYTDPQGLFDPRDIAKKEINENMCPLSITRKISPTMVEVWEVNEMIKPPL